jgi:hypothetical protein
LLSTVGQILEVRDNRHRHSIDGARIASTVLGVESEEIPVGDKPGDLFLEPLPRNADQAGKFLHLVARGVIKAQTGLLVSQELKNRQLLPAGREIPFLSTVVYSCCLWLQL